MVSRAAKILIGFLFVLVCSVSQAAQNQKVFVQMEKYSPVKISVDYPFDEPPVGGYMAIVVTINNGLSRDGKWHLKLDASRGYNRNMLNISSHFDFAVPAGQSRSFPISFPLPSDHSSSYYNQNVRGLFTGPDTARSNLYNNFSLHGGSDPRSVLLSPSIYRRYGSAVAEFYSKEFAGDVVVGSYRPELLPADWRCFSGYDVLITNEQDWLMMTQSVRRSILDAVADGGIELRFSLPDISGEKLEQLGIPGDGRVRRHGLGRIAFYEALPSNFADSNLVGAAAILSLKEVKFNFSDTLAVEKQKSLATALEETIEIKSANGGLISICILAFGVFVGPINLFVLSRGRNRLRLFITTPLISIASTLLLLMVIFLKDGIGGEGSISRLLLLNSEQHSLFYEQEQLSKTGLFFGNRFMVDGPAILLSRGSGLQRLSNAAPVGSFMKAGNTYSGDWFASKRLQGQNLRAHISTRERIELLGSEGGDAPVLFSNVRGICERIYFLDAQGQAWRGDNLKLGQQRALTRVSMDEFSKWYADQSRAAGDHLGRRIRSFGIRKNHFYADLSNWQQEGLETARGIDWRIHSQLFIGQLSGSEKKGSK